MSAATSQRAFTAQLKKVYTWYGWLRVFRGCPGNSRRKQACRARGSAMYSC